MRLLLDTHAVLWWLGDDRRLGSRARDSIEDPANDVLISVVSLWEITVKVRIGKLAADIDEIMTTVGSGDFTLLPVRPAHLVTLGGLPFHADHRDPFDHLLVAQAILEDATFLSDDHHTARYPVRSLACRDTPSRPTSP